MNDSTISWQVKTDMTSDPVELLIDCGAEICIISDKKTLKNKPIKKPIYRITGVTGKDSSFNTGGSLVGNFITDDNNDWLAEIHLVDSKYTGNFDGYVGLDFLKKHRTIIDLHTGTLKLHGRDKNVSFNDTIEILNEDTKNIENSNNSLILEEERDLSIEENMVLDILEEHENEPNQKIIRFVCSNPASTQPKLELAQCKQDRDAKPCRKCLSNRNKLLQSYLFSDDSLDSYQTANLFNETDEILHDPISEAKEYEKELEDMKIDDYDEETVKLAKIAKHKLSFPPEVNHYINYFGPKNYLPTKTIHNIIQHDEMSRQEFIFENLPKDHCTEEEIQKINQLIDNYPFQFYVDGDSLSKTDIIQHHIHLKPDAPIIHVKQFRLSEKMKQDVIEETRALEAQEVIRPSVSPYNSPVFMVGKKDEYGGMTDHRFVINFKKINEYTQIQEFPIPRVEELLDNFSKCKFFSSLDIKSAFHQIELYQSRVSYDFDRKKSIC